VITPIHSLSRVRWKDHEQDNMGKAGGRIGTSCGYRGKKVKSKKGGKMTKKQFCVGIGGGLNLRIVSWGDGEQLSPDNSIC